MKQLRRDWQIYNTSQLIANGILEIGDGYRAKNSEMGDVGLPFARAGNIDGGFHLDDADILDESSVVKAGEKISKPGDVVFTSKGTVGRFAFVTTITPKFVYSPQLCYWRVKDSSVINPRFLLYWMHSSDFKNQVHQVKGLTDMADYVSLGDQRKMNFIAPSLEKQNKIAAILSAYDDLIENNTRRIAILEEMAQSLYREWFVHFRFPAHEKNEMVPSALGMIPKGWEVVKFTSIADVLSGGTPKTNVAEYWDGSIPFFTPKDANSSFYALETEKNITELGLRMCNSKLYTKNTVFITARGTVGRVFLSSCAMAMNQSCYALKGLNGIDQYFVFLSIKHCVERLKKTANGAVFETIIVDTFKMLDTIKPPLEVIQPFYHLVAPIFDAILNILRQNTNLRRTRDLLLPKLISGELDVEALDIETGSDDTESEPAEPAAAPTDQSDREEIVPIQAQAMMLWD